MFRKADTAVFRTDVQALRALAVTAVLIFHLWPNRLPGGFVGVDAFFVISGFLIVGNLLREIDATGKIELWRFWARRARRLLPASLLVLACTTLAVLAWIPGNLWSQYLREVVGSALYVENWVVAADSVDYLAQHNGASPVQHFWTLSVEEQFYIVFPLMMVLLITAAGRLEVDRRGALLAGILVVTMASLIFSVWYTSANPPSAYFATTTRAWEFGAGALLAFLPISLPRRMSTVVFAAGTVALVAAAVFLNGAIPFPSVTAAWPVLAAAAMIVGGAGLGRLAARVPAWAPIQFVGNISYSMYLWHWPIIVVAPYVTGQALTLSAKLAIIVGTVVIAWLSTRFIEDPVRNSHALLGGGRSQRAITAWSAGGIAIVLALAGSGLVSLEIKKAGEAAASALIAAEPDCYGAAISLDAAGCESVIPSGTLTPDPAVAADDGYNLPECWSGLDEATFDLCSFGPENASVRLAAFGDSHNNSLLGACHELAAQTGWRIDVAGHNGCYWTAAVQQKPLPSQVENCEAWKQFLREYLAATAVGTYDAILVTHARFGLLPATQGDPTDAVVAGLVDEWVPQIARGERIIAIRDVPRLRPDVVTCMTLSRDALQCSSPESEALGERDALMEAAEITGSTSIDLTDVYCTAGVCSPVIGNVMAYSNEDHLTGTFARTLAPVLEQRLDVLLDGR